MNTQLQTIHAKIIKKWHKDYDPDKKTFLSKPEKRMIAALWQSKGNMGKAAKLLNMHEMLLLNYIGKSKLYQYHLKMIRELQIDNIACEVFEGAESGDATKQMFVLERKGNWIKKGENSSQQAANISININFVQPKEQIEVITINPEGEDNAI